MSQNQDFVRKADAFPNVKAVITETKANGFAVAF